MGYTHYWYKVRELPQKDFNNFVDDFNKVLPNFESVLCHKKVEEYDNELEINNQLVIFNGIGENSHETFYFERVVTPGEFEQYADDKTKKHIFDFTKTARKPYDIAVCSALIIAKKHFGEKIIISSDGDNEEWNESKQLCQKVLGYGESLDMSYDSPTSGQFVEVLKN